MDCSVGSQCTRRDTTIVLIAFPAPASRAGGVQLQFSRLPDKEIEMAVCCVDSNYIYMHSTNATVLPQYHPTFYGTHYM